MRLALGLLGSMWACAALAASGDAETAQRFRQTCSGCHGATVTTQASRDEVVRIIREGRPDRGMPSFDRALTQQQIAAIAGYIVRPATAPRGVGATIEAETVDLAHSYGFQITRTDTGDVGYLQYIDRGSYLCYENVDLTGVRSVEFRYAKGPDLPPRRIAIVVENADGSGRRNVGERVVPITGGWQTFASQSVGLAEAVSGTRRLCVMGLVGGGVFNLDKLTLSAATAPQDGITQTFELRDRVIEAAGHRFRLEKLGEAPGELWTMEFLDEGAIIATQKKGTLWFFKDGQRLAISGTPQVSTLGQGGLLTIRKHPDYGRNGWLYLSYTEAAPGGAMTRIVRGRLSGLEWVDEELIWAAPSALYTRSGEHFGGRITFAGDYLFFGIGERGQRHLAQDLSLPMGKIHRLHTDGRVPADNPFTANPGALPSIYSLGHRNPQGLAVNPRDGSLWASEHGPMGGDEVNHILAGRNYGWPVVTFGKNYDGTAVSELTAKEGMTAPAIQYTPSIAVSGITFYDAPRFPGWRGKLMLGSLAYQQLHLLTVEGEKVTRDEILFADIGRIRDITVDPDGYPCVVLNNPNGAMYRLVPVPPATSGLPSSLHLPQRDVAARSARADERAAAVQ
jgi:glucose/arabinose dehydrogenase